MKTDRLLVLLIGAFVVVACSKKEADSSPTAPPPSTVVPQPAAEITGSGQALPPGPINGSFDAIPTTLPLTQQLELHAQRLEQLWKVRTEATARKDAAAAKRTMPGATEVQKNEAANAYVEADQDLTNASVLLSPYAIAQQQAQNMIDDGYVLQTKKAENGEEEPTDEACKPDGGKRNCVRGDVLVVLFYIIFKPIGDLIRDGKMSSSNEFVKFLKWANKPLGGPNNDLRKIREAILMGDNGEISRLIRNPGKRPVEIVKNWRDKIIPESSNDINKTLRNPVKCVTRLWHDC